MRIAYFLFRMHHYKPHEYYEMSAGEKAVTRAFLMHEIDEINREAAEQEKAIEEARKG